MEDKKRFSEYLFNKYVEWMMNQKEPKTTSDFADVVGVNRQTINRLLEKGSDNIPQLRTVHALAKVIGSDIYEFLGITNSEIEFNLVKKSWENLPTDIKTQVVEIIRPYVKK